MRRFFIVIAGVAALAGARSFATAEQAPPPVSAAALPQGAGRETMVRVCSTCHAVEIVAQQRLTPEGWAELVETMANHGAVASDAELAEITAYLSKAYP